jgi:hypothetical protein
MSFPTMRYYTVEADEEGGPRIGISPSRWGRTFWNTLHYISIGYPETNPSPAVREAAFAMLVSLQFLLPCKACREHLADTFRHDLPLTPDVFETRQALGTYIVRLRDLVKRKHACPKCLRHKEHVFPQDVHATLFGPPPAVKALRWAIAVTCLLWAGSYMYHRRHPNPTTSTSYNRSFSSATPSSWARPQAR